MKLQRKMYESRENYVGRRMSHFPLELYQIWILLHSYKRKKSEILASLLYRNIMVDMHTNSSSKHPLSHIGQLLVTHLVSPTRGFYDLRCQARPFHLLITGRQGRSGCGQGRFQEISSTYLIGGESENGLANKDWLCKLMV
jgi:hypothetical protein